MRRMRPLSLSLSIVAFLLLFLVAGAAEAQSGRRAPKGISPPTPTPTPESTQPEQQKTKTPTQPQINLVVVADISSNLSLVVPFPEKVPTWVAKRLRDSSALAVAEGGQANRKDAIKRAKAMTEGFIIFLQLEESGLSPAVNSNNRANLDDVSISYQILEPVTGKAKSSGVIYLSQRNTIINRTRTGLPCYPGVRGEDYILLQASLEVAERIMSVLSVPSPPACQ